ncbi:MAG: HD domain-containing phosphohydrolase [Candidatus Limnocylindrales bacterium]
MFGSELRSRRPILLTLVFGAFLVIVGITATSQAAVVSTELSSVTLEAVVGNDSAAVRNLANSTMLESDVSSPGPGADRLAELETILQTLIRRGEILRAEIRRNDGSVIVGDRPGRAGATSSIDADFQEALANQPTIAFLPVDKAGSDAGGLSAATLLREYLPLSVGGKVVAVVTVWRDATPMLALIDGVRRDVVLITISAALVACVLLFLIFRAAQLRLTRQTLQLLETARRDPLTGMLNHGALVADLAVAIETARATGEPLALALIDIDNFRLLNENHGHSAGDEALHRVAAILLATVPPAATVGRYGPDEFLVIVGSASIGDLEPAVWNLRTKLLDIGIASGHEDRLPITVSAGIATYPDDGGSLAAVLSVLVRTLEAARSSGGDDVRVARLEREEPPSGSYDVLRGLIIAIDTKDRYTKRHSEDVARYAAFLALRIGLDDTMIATIKRAGLLHDVGKIGTPDTILHKPGRLTTEEYDIVKQHVALGDMIVRNVPDIDLVRAGIRHHHERWDGDGYLAGLAGEEIPLIARILAVGDAFSAMTTTRPYRKALDVREALTRLADAAGTQLDERLVEAFIEGIETVPDAPLPGLFTGASGLWTPRVEAA